MAGTFSSCWTAWKKSLKLTVQAEDAWCILPLIGESEGKPRLECRPDDGGGIMRFTRRKFLKSCAQSTAVLGVAGISASPGKDMPMSGTAPDNVSGKEPDPVYRSLAEVVLETAHSLGSSYADIRVIRHRTQQSSIRTQAEFGTTKIQHVPEVYDLESFGFGVRVLVNSTWGFAASSKVERDEVARVTREAVGVAKANSELRHQPVQLAPVTPAVALFRTPFTQDPFAVSLKEKLDFLRTVNDAAMKVPKVFMTSSYLSSRSEHKWFASSEGSYIEQFIQRVEPGLSCTAVDKEQRKTRDRSVWIPPVTGGWEYIESARMLDRVQQVGEECVQKLSAPSVVPGKKDLVLLPSHLSLTIHESIGHSTELDRALGYEANFAGTSFLTPDKLGKYRVGSDLVNMVGDRILPGGLSTCGYDDDGVKTIRFDILRNGIFVGYQTIRDQVHLIGDKESHACCYADSYASIPFQRIPNVWLKPSSQSVTLDDLIGGVDDGILIDGTGSWSIDQQRYNFQFGGDCFWEIKGGKKGRMLDRVAYQSRTPDFWQACDGIADERFWQNYGLTSDGKGQPMQFNEMSHGSAPARFRQINVLLTE
jgi:TldD protein